MSSTTSRNGSRSNGATDELDLAIELQEFIGRKATPTITDLIEAELLIAGEWERRRNAKRARDRRYRQKRHANQITFEWRDGG